MRMISELCYGDAFEPRHRLELCLPETDPFKVFAYYHGGGLENGDKRTAQVFAPYLCESGIAAANILQIPAAKTAKNRFLL